MRKSSDRSGNSSGFDHTASSAHNADDNELMDNEEQTFSKGSKFTDRLLSLFLAIWFIFGNYWIFGIYEPRYEPIMSEPSNWCDKNVYIFALIHLFIYYIFMVFTLICILLLTIFTQTPYLIMKFQDC
jgi:hypothetical protein